jgi:DNA-binding GntR family transcriptional regulator
MKKATYQTKSDIIYEEIKNDIINGRYEPNERIIISEVARQFGASDIPVREAMRQLESDGLIQSKPYVGAVVTNFDQDDIRKIYQIRTVLEGMAARMAVKNIGQSHLKKLNSLIAKMRRACQSENYGLLSNLNRDFHEIIYSASGNEYLKGTIFALWNMSVRARAIFTFVSDRALEAVEEHEKILGAIEIKNGVLTEKLIIRHMNSHLKALKLYFKQQEKK